MSLAAGVRLGPYEVIAPLGQGGRGSALRLAERLPATAKCYENAPVARFPRRSACGDGERAERVEPPRVGVGPHEHLKKDRGDFAQWPW